MSSIQERLQLKREPLDKWSIREQLCLASAVARSGDQNWMSVSRALKPFGDPNRPADWFHQKNCAAQYGALLSTVDTPKRKKRTSGPETIAETPAENILRRLITERQAELKNLLVEEKTEYRKLQEDMLLLQSGKVSEEQLDKWCKEIDEEERRGEQEAQAHAQWLKEREARKQEIERTWRPTKVQYHVAGQKRKISDVTDNPSDGDVDDVINQQQSSTVQHQQMQQQFIIQQTQEPNKPALSPLLTSLLKSPSQVQNASSSILHTAITKPNQNPTIASLLNSSTGVTVSPGLQHLVSSAIGQEPVKAEDTSHAVTPDLLDDAHLPNLKIDDLANSILVQDGPLPEIKKEEVDDIISEIIENAQDIVADPEQHLQLDGNGDITLELEDLEDEEDVPEIAESPPKEETVSLEKPEPSVAPPILATPVAPVDPFEFQEDPVIFDSGVKPSAKQDTATTYTPLYQQQSFKKIEEKEVEKPVEDVPAEEKIEEQAEESAEKTAPGSVEIVEVVAEEVGSEKELNKAQIEDIVHSSKQPDAEEIPEEKAPPEIKEEMDQQEAVTTNVASESVAEVKEEIEETVPPVTDDNIAPDVKSVEEEPLKAEVDVTTKEEPEEEAIAQDFNEDLYDSMNMEVKIDKTGKTKRDYSRTKKKEEKGFDMLLAIEKAQLEEGDTADEGPSSDVEKKTLKTRVKVENDRSSSPWTEEEDVQVKGSKRRVSTPGTPVDSFPNSPASSSAFYEDDREHRNWKKSVMLVYNRLASNKYASLFLKPITEDHAPGYSSVVYRPMDLQTIKKNIDSGVIRTSLEFKRDVMLMFTNAIMYNKTNDTIYNMATQMQQESIHPIEILLQAQGEVNVPLRRETRTSESGTKRKRPTEENVKNKKRKED